MKTPPAAAMVLLFPVRAWAMPGFVSDVPNASNPLLVDGQPCKVCHERPQGGGDLNPFGRAYDANRGGQGWGRLFMLDSDGDDQTNGLELGDPRGVWTPGAVPERTTGLSLPGDAESRVPSPGSDAGTVDVGVEDIGLGDLPDALASRDGGELDLSLDQGLSELGPRDLGAKDLGSREPGGTTSSSDGCTCSRRPFGEDPTLIGLAGLGLARALLRRRRAHRVGSSAASNMKLTIA